MAKRKLEDFFQEANEFVKQSIEKRMKEMTATIASGPGRGESKSLEKSCKLLHGKLDHVFRGNMKKFRIYCQRNVFRGAVQHEETSASSQELREALSKAIEARNRLSSGCEQLELLLGEMRRSMFAVRLSKQSLEQFDVQSLGEAASAVREQCGQLSSLQRLASELENRSRSQTAAAEGVESSNSTVHIATLTNAIN